MNLSFVKLFSKRPAALPRAARRVRSRGSCSGAACSRSPSGRWSPAVPAHAQAPSRTRTTARSRLPDPLTARPRRNTQKSLPGVPLSSQIVFQVLAAEVALQRDQPAPAYQTYLALARDTHDPRLAQRATEIAMAAQSPIGRVHRRAVVAAVAPNSDRAAQFDASLLVAVRQTRRGRADARARTREGARRTTRQRDSGAAIAAFARPEPVGALNVLQDLTEERL